MLISVKPRQKSGYQLEMMDGELLLYHLNETRILYLNQTASLIWQLCDGSQSVNDIITLLCDAYPESADAISSEVPKTLQQFLDFGCVEIN